jgi:uncharacterized LabA/DUF88 family protein
MERVMIFVDGSNFYHGLRANLDRTDVDFFKFSVKLAGSGRWVHTHYYNSPRRRAEDEIKYRKQQRFFSYLRSVKGLTLHLGRLEPRTRTCGSCGASYGVNVEKDVDVNLAVDMLAGAFDDQYDACVLVSGDGDFANLLAAVKRVGKKVKFAYFGTGRARALTREAEEFIHLTEGFMKDCWKL